MSVAFTEQAVVERRKTVTRRKGWLFLKPGDTLTLCRKVMGRKKGEPLVRLAEVQVVRVDRGPLCGVAGPYTRNEDGSVTYPEMALEGFPDMSPYAFMEVPRRRRVMNPVTVHVRTHGDTVSASICGGAVVSVARDTMRDVADRHHHTVRQLSATRTLDGITVEMQYEVTVQPYGHEPMTWLHTFLTPTEPWPQLLATTPNEGARP
jgi:hypothetical protein